MQKLFILFGSPGSGKSTSCNILKRISQCKVVQKETTRQSRDSDGVEIKHVDVISKRCDFRYNQYNYEYGFSSQDIWVSLKRNKSGVVIVNDIRTIKLLKRKLGNLAHPIYIHSNIDREKIVNISRRRYPHESDDFLAKDIAKRIEKIKTIHRKYIENTYLFDSAIINVYNEGEPPEQLALQLQQVCDRKISSTVSAKSTCRIIIIAGGSYTGKDDLVNALKRIEPNKVCVYQKGTTRPKREGDNNELLHLEKLSNDYDIVYDKNGYKYGLSTKGVWEKLSEEKIVLIVLSDFKTIMSIKEKFNQICSIIYLHANIDEDEKKKEKANMDPVEFSKREQSTSELHDVYIRNMNIFDHVLLNTSDSEDLYEQAFNILDHYLD